jgi:murein DD-endopeptidase MepM/ murein hydrolase activator NlpD
VTDKQRAALLKSMWADLRKTEHGYVEGGGGGVNWTNAERKHDQLMTDLLKASAQTLVYPIAGSFNVLEGGLHCTAPCTGTTKGNWSIDFICKAGLGIVAVEAATITRFSGNDPSDDAADAEGVYGWSTWYRSSSGLYTYFATHQGRRYPSLRVGDRVEAGDLIGYVGDQRYRADHLHLGVTSSKGEADAKARIQAVANAARVS